MRIFRRPSPSAFRLCALGAACLLRAAAADGGLAPAKNWVLPLFTKEGYHSMTLRGAEVHPFSSDRIDVTDLNITVFSGDPAARVETVLLSSRASYFPHEKKASGRDYVRLIRDDCEITGQDWTYQEEGKKVSIRRHAHVVYYEQLHGLIK